MFIQSFIYNSLKKIAIFFINSEAFASEFIKTWRNVSSVQHACSNKIPYSNLQPHYSMLPVTNYNHLLSEERVQTCKHGLLVALDYFMVNSVLGGLIFNAANG